MDDLTFQFTNTLVMIVNLVAIIGIMCSFWWLIKLFPCCMD